MGFSIFDKAAKVGGKSRPWIFIASFTDFKYYNQQKPVLVTILNEWFRGLIEAKITSFFILLILNN